MGKKIFVLFTAVFLLMHVILPYKPVKAQTGGFAIQVTPSPIVETIKPGVTKTVEVKIRNQNTQKETLKMGLRAFSVDTATGEVQLKTEEPKDVVSWVQFSDPTFDVDAGEWFTQKVTFSVPSDAGFTYSFAITVSRAVPQQETSGRTAIEGSVAIFTLLSINRPDAQRKIDVVSFSSKKKVYEYLPGSFELSIKNSGNTIVQPAGNIYIQRGISDTEPISVLPVNVTSAYILPDVTRTLSAEWTTGFPYYKQVSDASDKKKLIWNWSELQNFRFGRYTAKAIIIYNDGVRDVPAEAIIDFWVIPWKLLTGLVFIIVLLVTGIVTVFRKTMKVTRKKKKDEPKEE